MPNNYFEFKQFRINQDRAAMKVGTDGVLLGAWACLSGKESRILDVGTGTGLVAMMAAQRCSEAIIDAVEIDSSAAGQAEENVENSPWKERIHVYPVSIQDFAGTTNKIYNHILSNPPFFVESLKSPELSRTLARHTDSLAFNDLTSGVLRLLSEEGCFSVIYPYTEGSIYERKAREDGLFCNRRTFVRGVPGGPVIRILMEFSRRDTKIEENELVIEVNRHQYSPEYIDLTKDFYLRF